MGTSCAPVAVDLVFCLFVLFERDFMLSPSDNNQAGVAETFSSNSRALDYMLNIDQFYFKEMVSQIYPTELQLDEANSFDTVACFLTLTCP